jgi:hypothetical protein
MGAGQLAHYGVAASPDEFHALHEQLSQSAVGASPVHAFETPGAIGATRFDAFATADPDGHPVVVTSMTRTPSFGTTS